MNKEEKTIKKMQQLIPEIMAIQIGCKVLLNNYYLPNNEIGTIIATKPSIDILMTNKKHQYFQPHKFSNVDIKILGRDIILNDIVKIFKMTNDFRGCDIVYRLWNWNGKHNFKEQSQECKDFIGDLISAMEIQFYQ